MDFFTVRTNNVLFNNIFSNIVVLKSLCKKEEYMVVFSRLEHRITNILIQESHDEIEKEKISFGVKLILNDLWKFIIVYLFAIQFNCFFQTLITHLVFYILRQVCFGFHFQNNLICLIASVFALPIGVFFINKLNYLNDYIDLAAALLTVVLILFAPVHTAKRPLYNQEHRAFLRKKLLIRLLIIWAVIFVSNVYPIHSFISYGIILIAISVLIQKLEGVKLYENQKSNS